MTTPAVLAFADRKVGGAFAVTDQSGATVASIKVGFWSGSSFAATTATGAPLCTGRKAGVFSRTWRATDATGQDIVELRASMWSTNADVILPPGRNLALQGRLFGRDWAVSDEQGNPVLSSVPTSSAWSFRPDAWVVQCLDDTLELGQVVGIVELHRLMVKASRNNAAATT